MALTALPFLPTFLRRRPEAELQTTGLAPAPAPWPGNPASYDDDLLQSQANEAELARQLTAARALLDGDEQVRRLDQAERRAATAEAEHQRLAGDLAAAHRANLLLRKQLDREFGYDEAAIDAIESGAGEPTGKRALT